MLEAIKILQKEKISDIIYIAKNKESVTFKSPTGSGKTIMMLDLMNRYLGDDKKLIFIVSSLSKAQLAWQNYTVFIKPENSRTYNCVKPFYINSDVSGESVRPNIDDGFNVYILPTDKFKSGSLLKDCGVFENFIKEKIRNGFKIYLIKDEAHRETSNLNELGKHFSKIFNFSATPKHKPDVEITEENAVKFHLIKDLRRWNTKTITNEEESIKELKKALDLFYKNDNDGIKRKYEKFLPKFNPAFMIQISNKNKADNEINMIKKCLSEYSADIQYVILSNDTKHQETNNKELLKSSRNMWKGILKEPLCPVSVIIFKLVMTEGYDIPRACALFQIRDTESGTLDEQVLGRIRRNPILKDWEEYYNADGTESEANKLAVTAYAWGDFKKDDRYKEDVAIKSKEIIENFKVKRTKINDLWNKNQISFDKDVLKKILEKGKKYDFSKSIFELYKNWNKLSDEAKIRVESLISSDNEWFDTLFNIEEIIKANNDYLNNYEKSIEEDTEATFLEKSCFWILNHEHECSFDCWVWKKDGDSCMFDFESEAERKFINELQNLIADEDNEINLTIVGKNWYFNEKDNAIKFGYVWNGVKYSYPDFVVKDKNGNVFIIEVKNLRDGHVLSDEQAKKYKAKIGKLKEAYEATSKKLPYYFSVILYEVNGWELNTYYCGKKISYSEEEEMPVPLSELFTNLG